MYLEIYIDKLFLLNLCVDFILLNVVRKLLRWKTRQIRIILASILGAISSCIFALLPSLYGVIRFALTYILVSVLMIRIAFRVKKIRDLLRGIVVLCLVTYCVGGIITSLYQQRKSLQFYMELITNLLFSRLTLVQICIYLVVSILCILLAVRFLRYYKQMNKEIYEVWLSMNQSCVHTLGLVDTGNCLFDPISGKPVIVVEMSLMEEVLGTSLYNDLKKVTKLEDSSYHISCENATKIRLIPFQSIGKKRGILPAIVLDEVQVKRDTQFLSSKKVIAALYDDTLSQSKEYQVILHKSLL